MDLTPLKTQLEMTLSYLEPMHLDKIYLELSSDFLKDYPEFKGEHLAQALIEMVNSKEAKCVDFNGHKAWIRVFPSDRTMKKRLRKLMNSLLAKLRL